MSYAQWILRNFMLHDSHTGFLHLKHRLDMIVKINELGKTDSCDIPEESRFLLDIDTNRLAEGDIDCQEYWVYAMEAARSALPLGHTLQASMTTLMDSPPLWKNSTLLLMEEIQRE